MSDILTTAPALAAEVAGVKRATLVPHVWPERARRVPEFGFGLLPARTPLGRWGWKGAAHAANAGLRRGRDELNEARALLGLAPLTRFHGGTSEELAIVATFLQLEYSRRWPAHVRVTGPLLYELPGGSALPDSDALLGPDALPVGDVSPLAAGGDGPRTSSEHFAGAAGSAAAARPLVIVAPSTAKDPECRLIRSTLAALADEPVRVVASMNRQAPKVPVELPANAAVVDWLSYSQAIPHASLVVCHGGHGTVASALSCGAPVLVSPVDGDMAENGARVSWAGCGLMLPRRLTRAGTLRRAVRQILGEPRFARQAEEISRWAAENDAAERAATAVEELV